jgi:hypothetical protein
MPTDKYTKFILTVIACGLLALVVQNAMGPSDTPVAQSQAAPPNTAQSNTVSSWSKSNTASSKSNKEARASGKLYLCNARGCIEIEPCDRRIQHSSGACADATGDGPTTTPP